MTFRQDYPTLTNFLAGWFPEADLDGQSDQAIVTRYAATVSARERAIVREEAQRLLDAAELPTKALAKTCNRHFADDAAARAWLCTIKAHLEKLDP